MCKCMSMHHIYLHRCCTDVLCIEHFVPWQRYSALLLPALLYSIDAMLQLTPGKGFNNGPWFQAIPIHTHYGESIKISTISSMPYLKPSNCC
jgi:hypothetical protein